MILAYTICSVNYFAQAHTLGESLQKLNPDIRFVIGVVDKLQGKTIDTAILPPFELLEVDKIGIPDFQEMCDRYDITELNTAVKPYYIHYFYDTFPEIDSVIYFDPDIIVYDDLQELKTALTKHNIVVTPHLVTPYNDDKWQNENDLVKTGIYNLGFIATSRSAETLRFVKWWMEKLKFGAKIDLCQGYFTDQHWIDLVPIFFDNVFISKDIGYNVAYWNLHERHCSQDSNGTWKINDTYPLHFFHYSGFNPFKASVVSKYQNRILFDERPDIVPLFEYYRVSLLKNHQAYWQEFPCVYIKPRKVKRLVRVREIFKFPFKKLRSIITNY
jgi:hypothetical protein